MRRCCALAAVAIATACAANANDPAAIAERLTRAVYADDAAAVAASMDDATKKTVTRAEVGALSDKLHSLGDFRSLALKKQNAGGRYEYAAVFERATWFVELRLDPDGKVSAYRISPTG